MRNLEKELTLTKQDVVKLLLTQVDGGETFEVTDERIINDDFECCQIFDYNIYTSRGLLESDDSIRYDVLNQSLNICVKNYTEFCKKWLEIVKSK